MTINENELVELIKSKGYWEVEITPYSYDANKIQINEILHLVEKCQVRKWGRRYPRISRNADMTGISFTNNNYFQSLTDDGMQHKEIWRMYQSGQFVHYLALREDWGLEDPYGVAAGSSRKVQNIIMTLYTVTEIFLFASRLASNNVFGDSMYLILKLHNAYDRVLIFSDIERELDHDYICKMDDPIIVEKKIATSEILSQSERMAMNAVIDIFRRFNWNSNQIANILRDDQEKLNKAW